MIPLDDLRRFSRDPAQDGSDREELTWGKASPDRPLLRITPGDKTSFSYLTEVTRHRPYQVEVAILGKKDFSTKFGQWRASCTSLPLDG